MQLAIPPERPEATRAATSVHPSAPPPARTSLWRSALTTPVVLAALLASLTFCFCCLRFNDPDLWWHLEMGREVWQTHAVPSADHWSSTVYGHPWVAHEWLAQLSLYLTYATAGYRGLQLWLCLLSAATVALAYLLSYRYSGSPAAALAGGFLAFFFGTVGFSLRPQVIGYLFLVIELLILERAISGLRTHAVRPANPNLLWSLPPLFAVWVNCHGSYSLGIGILAIALACAYFDAASPAPTSNPGATTPGPTTTPASLSAIRAANSAAPPPSPSAESPHPAATRLKPSQAAAILTASVLALLLNPVGAKLLIYPLNVFTHQQTSLGFVAEWLPASTQDPRDAALFLLLGAAAIAGLRGQARLTIFELLTLIPVVFLALEHVRMAYVFGIIAGPVLARMLADRQSVPDAPGPTPQPVAPVPQPSALRLDAPGRDPQPPGPISAAISRRPSTPALHAPTPHPDAPGPTPQPPASEPRAPGSTPQPLAPGPTAQPTAPEPRAPGSTPQPLAPGPTGQPTAPEPRAPGSTPQPLAPGPTGQPTAPEPRAPGSTPQPRAPGSTPQPLAPGPNGLPTAPEARAPGSTPQPLAPGPTGQPTAPEPRAPGSTPQPLAPGPTAQPPAPEPRAPGSTPQPLAPGPTGQPTAPGPTGQPTAPGPHPTRQPTAPGPHPTRQPTAPGPYRTGQPTAPRPHPTGSSPHPPTAARPDHLPANALLLLAAALCCVLAFPGVAKIQANIDSQNPVKAVQFLRSTHPQGPLLNDYKWGGYLVWALPEYKVFVDGRGDVYDWDGVLAKYRDWSLVHSDPASLLNEYSIQLCLLPLDAPMSQVLPHLAGWKQIYRDEVSQIFARN